MMLIRKGGEKSRLALLCAVGAAGVSACGQPQQSESAVKQVSAPLTVVDFPIGTDRPVPLQYPTGDYMSLAGDGTNHLAVFYDGGRIRGVRYEDSGRVLDLDEWIRLGRNDENAGTQAYTDLAFGGGEYLAVYYDGSDDVSGIFAQGIQTDGTLLSEPVLVAEGGLYASVAFNGTDFTVAFYDGDIGLARVALDGSVVEGSKTQVTTGSSTNRPKLAMADDVGLVVFEQSVNDERRVYAARFEASGNVLDPGGVLVSEATTSSADVSVAAGASEFFVVWTATSSPAAVMGSVVNYDGSVPLREFAISRSTDRAGGSAVAYDGSEYLVVWQDERGEKPQIYGTRMTNTATHVDPEDVALTESASAGQSWNLDLSWDAGRYSLAYVNSGIEGRFIDAALNPLDPGVLELTPLPNAQISPVSAYNGQSYVLGFSDEREDLATQFRSVRIDDAGTVLDPEGIQISGAGAQASGGLASNGQVTLYTWRDFSNENVAYKRTLSADGVLSGAEVWLPGAEGGGQVVSNGDTFLALYSDGDNGNGNANEIWGQAFDASGGVDGAATKLVTISRPRYGVQRLGDEYLLYYSGQEIGGAAITGSVVRVSASGEITAEYEPVVEGMLTASAGGSDEQMLFSWQDGDTEGLRGRLLHRDDGWGEPFVLSDQVTEGAPAIAWDGSQFVVVWSEDRTAMWTRNVLPDGSMTEPEQLFVGDYGFPRLTTGEGEQMLLSYVRWLEFSRSRRVESRIVGPLGEGVDDAPIDDPVPDDPTTDDPMTDEPGSDISSTDDPTDPGMDEPTTDDPMTADSPSAQDPADSSAGDASSAAEQTAQPGSTAATNPGADGFAASGTSESTSNDAANGSGSDPDSEGGCSVANGNKGSPDFGGWLALLLAAAALSRRRRRIRAML